MPNTIPATGGRSHKLLMAVAAAWMILSLAIGGAVQADAASANARPAQAVAEITQD
ncbi:MAG: hypothetical protein ACR2GO_04550 [Candidatus Limnocylindria bacterium]